MDKVLVIIPDNNKSKYISKGFSSAFRDLSYFVFEKKIYDLNINEINRISPEIIFIFWSDVKQVNELISFFESIKCEKTKIINYAEDIEDIPSKLRNRNNSYCFSYENKKKKYSIIPAVQAQDYKRKFTGYKYLITFAGNPAYLNREQLLSKIVYNFGIINIFCRSYDFYKSVDEIYKNNFLDSKYIDLYRESYRGYVENQKELSYIYSHSKVNIDMLSNKNKKINYRCFEILASGGFLIAPYSDILVKNFENGKEIETYSTDFELIDKIRFYLTNTNLAQLIIAKGKKNVISNHYFYDRLKIMLKVIYG